MMSAMPYSVSKGIGPNRKDEKDPSASDRIGILQEEMTSFFFNKTSHT